MASSDQWPTVASAGKNSGKNRSGLNTKKPTKEHQQQVLAGLTEMFQSTLEPEVILSVAHSCDWELQSCIDALIALSSTVESQNKETRDKDAFVLVSNDLKKRENIVLDELQPDILKMNKNELQKQQEELKKFEKIKKSSTKNRMGSFRGNISKLDSNYKENQKSETYDSIWDLPNPQAKNETTWHNNNFLTSNAQYVLPQMPYPPTPWTAHQKPTTQVTSPYHVIPQTSFDQDPLPQRFNSNRPRNESELCGLKVQYRTAGMESSSDDDDADVVIEEELNCSIPTSVPVNVSQLLSSSIQTPPQVSYSCKTTATTTPSPPQTPRRSVHQATVERIKTAIKNGEKILVIMRGLPGSGKSFLAKNLIASTIDGEPSDYVCSTDDFFVTIGRGVYKFDPRRLDEAHSLTQKKVYDALKEGKTPVIVDNTNTQAWEMRPYAAMAVKRGYTIEILESDTPWAYNVNELAKRNVHQVPKEKIRQMLTRFEHGITGKKLLDRFSLKSELSSAPQTPAVASAADVPSENLSENLRKVKQIESEPLLKNDTTVTDDPRDERDTVKVEEEKPMKINFDELCDHQYLKNSPEQNNYLLQALGAIGSERKNSLAPSEVTSPVSEEELNSEIKDNVLSPTWDFTMLVDGKVIHSRRSTKSPMSPAEIKQQDKEFGKEIERTESCPMKKLEEEDRDMRFAVHNFLNELAQGYNYTKPGPTLPGLQQRQSTVVITEVFEEQEIKETPNSSAEYSNSDSDELESPKSDVELESSDNKDETFIDNNSHSENQVQIVMEESIEPIKKIEKASTEDKDVSFVDAENLLSLKTEEPKEYVQSQSTLGTIFSIIKTSILGASEDENSQQAKNEIEQGRELNECSVLEEPKVAAKIANSDSPQPVTNIENVIENPIAEIKAAIDSVDNGAVNTEVVSNDKTDDGEFYSLENEPLVNINAFSIEDQNPFISALEKLEGPKKAENKRQLISESVYETSKVSDDPKESILDNINRITWKEAPFPVDDVSLPTVDLESTKKTDVVPKSDASTNTTYYDFNVLYIGVTSEPTYRVIDTFSRHINEGPPVPKVERPPLKLMLDKSSMTGDVFTREGNPDMEDEQERKNRIPELMELFPNIPRDYLIEIFEKVKEDFDWAVELLLEGVPNDMSVKLLEENSLDEFPLLERDEDKDIFTTPEPFGSASADLPATPAPSENLNDLEEQEEEKVEDKEVSKIEPEILQTIKTDVSDDTCSTSTASVSRTESTEDEKSSDSDELMELNLGFDFIKALESKFGDPDFQIPDGFVPAIQIKKSMAEELYACWIESMYQQLNARHEQLDQMIAKDAEFAKSLERQLELEETRAAEKPSEPNLDQIMDMELALAKYKNELKSIISREAPDDLAARLSRQMLHESVPDIDLDAFDDILKAHNGNFREAFEVIEMNTGKSITPRDTLKKQKILMERAREEDKNVPGRQPPIIVVRAESKDEKLSYKAALATARDSRQEAQRQFSLKMQNYNKAAEAYRKGYPEVAAYYSQMARLHSKNIEAAHAAAATAFVEAQSWDDEETLDLHNLFVSEALIALDEFLEYHLNKLMKSNKRSSTIYIITGRGARSNNGTSKIKPAIAQKLTSRNIKFSEANPGCLKVTLYRKNGTTD